MKNEVLMPINQEFLDVFDVFMDEEQRVKIRANNVRQYAEGIIDLLLKDKIKIALKPNEPYDIPLDLNSDAILRRLDRIIAEYGEATEKNEMSFSVDVGMIIFQLEIYDQIWFVQHISENGKHSKEACELVEKIIARLEKIPDDCSFPPEALSRTWDRKCLSMHPEYPLHFWGDIVR